MGSGGIELHGTDIQTTWSYDIHGLHARYSDTRFLIFTRGVLIRIVLYPLVILPPRPLGWLEDIALQRFLLLHLHLHGYGNVYMGMDGWLGVAGIQHILYVTSSPTALKYEAFGLGFCLFVLYNLRSTKEIRALPRST